MSETITTVVSDRICKHMNDDHAEALVLYIKAYGNVSEVESAKMLSIDQSGMTLAAAVAGDTKPVRIEFDHQLQDAEDAHHTLIAMLKAARS
jgi:putative heme iron utilization protein